MHNWRIVKVETDRKLSDTYHKYIRTTGFWGNIFASLHIFNHILLWCNNTSNPSNKIKKNIYLSLNYLKSKHKYSRKIKGICGFYYWCKLSIAPASKFRINRVISGLLDIPIHKKAPSDPSFSNQPMTVTERVQNASNCNAAHNNFKPNVSWCLW